MAEEANTKITQVGDSGIAIGKLIIEVTSREEFARVTHQLNQLLERLGVALVIPEEQKATSTVSPQARAVAQQIATQLEAAEQRFGGPIGDPDVYLRLGNMALDADNYAEAVNYYAKALALKPDYAYAWYIRGHALSNLGRYQEAVASYDEAIALKQDDDFWCDFAWCGRGDALSDLGRYQEAVASYDEAIAIDPIDVTGYWAWNGRGVALQRLGRETEAQESFKTAQAAVNATREDAGAITANWRKSSLQ